MGREAYREAKTAADLAGDDPEAMLAVGNCLYFLGLFEKANAALEQAVELNPNSAHACGAGGFLLGIMGRAEEGIEQIQRGMRLSPRDPQLYLFHNWLCYCHLVAGQPAEAIACGERSVRARPRFIEAWVYLAAALAVAGRGAEAARAVAKAREIVPELGLGIFRQPRTEGTTWGKLIDGLRLAGLPE
jgi:tetratricopeptide (TPR) repeat protein